ncbi:hypothetical protein D3C77_424910 [compost metagenome]
MLAFAQGVQALFKVLLLVPQAAELLHLALLLAIFLQQFTEQADLLCQGLGFCLGFVVEQGDGRALLLQLGAGCIDPRLQPWQLGAPLVEAVAQLHQLLQAIAVGAPSIAQASEGFTLKQLFTDLAEALFSQSLLFCQVQQLLLAFAASLFGLLFE